VHVPVIVPKNHLSGLDPVPRPFSLFYWSHCQFHPVALQSGLSCPVCVPLFTHLLGGKPFVDDTPPVSADQQLLLPPRRTVVISDAPPRPPLWKVTKGSATKFPFLAKSSTDFLPTGPRSANVVVPLLVFVRCLTLHRDDTATSLSCGPPSSSLRFLLPAPFPPNLCSSSQDSRPHRL